MNKTQEAFVFGLALMALFLCPCVARAQAEPPRPASKSPLPETVLIDTDIGDDIDDAFAVGLALQSPELKIDGISTAWGNTALRARLVRRLLSEASHAEIPVAEGIATKSPSPFTQAHWAERGPAPDSSLAGPDFILQQAAAHPGEITLVAIGPLTNIGAAIGRDLAAFRKLNRVVLMGGSVRKGYGDLGFFADRGPEAEYNIHTDVPAAQKLFRSGVPIFMMPLDSTQLKLDEVKRAILFSQGTPLTDALTLLYQEWGQQTPTLFDVMAVAYVLNPDLCPVTPMHIDVTDDGFTREIPGAPNASVCLASDSDRFFRFVLPRLMRPPDRRHSDTPN